MIHHSTIVNALPCSLTVCMIRARREVSIAIYNERVSVCVSYRDRTYLWPPPWSLILTSSLISLFDSLE